uniref:Uncharacterized protein n=1 Tax=Arundo donax TaxID=35708 RepID=A0A0A9E5F8_ARUDO
MLRTRSNFSLSIVISSSFIDSFLAHSVSSLTNNPLSGSAVSLTLEPLDISTLCSSIVSSSS